MHDKCNNNKDKSSNILAELPGTGGGRGCIQLSLLRGRSMQEIIACVILSHSETIQHIGMGWPLVSNVYNFGMI